MPVFLYVSNADPTHADLITAGNTSACSTAVSTMPRSPTTATWPRGWRRSPGSSTRSCSTRSWAALADKAVALEALAAWLAAIPRRSATTRRLDRDEAGAMAGRRPGQGRPRAAAWYRSSPCCRDVWGSCTRRLARLPRQVATAIGEHYRPLSATAPFPATLGGALLAVTDKVDNIVGAWVAGEKPTGSRDPYGLRRAAMGIVRIALEGDLRLPLDRGSDRGGRDVHTSSRAGSSTAATRSARCWRSYGSVSRCCSSTRARTTTRSQAALGSSAPDVPGVAARARAVGGPRATGDAFTDVVTAYNRCASLAAKAGASAGRGHRPICSSSRPSRSLFEAHEARGTASRGISGRRRHRGRRRRGGDLRDPVDRYFDDVLVMDGDPDMRQNRLAQLAAVRDLLRGIGDLSRIPV